MLVSARFLPAISLQPSNASPWRRAVSLTNAERRPLNMSPLATIMDPWNCAGDLLPWLAWGFSVDIWNEKWPELTKRWVIANSVHLHRLKTTAAGIRAHVALAGGEVRRIVRPPARAYYTPAMTDAERLTWLDSLPQIRIRLFALHETATGRFFWSGHTKRSFWGAAFMRSSRGLSIYGRRAFLYHNGVETPMRLEQMSLPGEPPFERIHITGPAPRGRRFWGVGFFRRLTAQTSIADTRVLTVRLSSGAAAIPLATGLRPVDIRPQRIAERHIAPIGKGFFGKAATRRFYQPSQAARYLYDRIAMHTGDVLDGNGGHATCFWGHGRYGIRPYTAELKISVPMRRHPRAIGRFWTGHWRRADMAPLQNVISAVRVSQAFRDRILIDPTIYRTIQLSDNLRLGEFRLGQLKRTA